MTACAWQVALGWSHHRCAVFVLLYRATVRFACCFAVHCWLVMGCHARIDRTLEK